jgi:tetratricopeptide (TPR) repeat protein
MWAIILKVLILVCYLLLGLATAIEGVLAQAECDIPPPPTVSQTVVQKLPLNAKQRSALQAALDGHHYDTAEFLLASEIQQNPRSAQLLAFLGSVSFLNGNCINAAIAIKKAEALNALENRDRFILAMAYVALERPNWARPEPEKLARSDQKRPLYPYWLSRLDYRDMNFESAATNAQRAIDLDPTFMKAYDNLGLTYEALGKLDEAIKAYQQAATLDQQENIRSPWPLLNLGALLLKVGRLNEAETDLRESLNCNPRFLQAHFQLGFLLEHEERIGEAIRELEEAIACESNYPEPYYALGRIYNRIGDEAKAKRAFSTFQELKELKSRDSKSRTQSK